MSVYEFYGAWTQHIVGPDDAFRVWFLKPATFVLAVAAPEITAELVRVYMRPIDALRRSKINEIDAVGGVATVADFRFTEFTKAARVEAKEYYKTSPQKGKIRARYMAVKESQNSTMNHRLLSMNTSLMSGHLPILGVDHPQEALNALGAQPPTDDPMIQTLQDSLGW